MTIVVRYTSCLACLVCLVATMSNAAEVRPLDVLNGGGGRLMQISTRSGVVTVPGETRSSTMAGSRSSAYVIEVEFAKADTGYMTATEHLRTGHSIYFVANVIDGATAPGDHVLVSDDLSGAIIQYHRETNNDGLWNPQWDTSDLSEEQEQQAKAGPLFPRILAVLPQSARSPGESWDLPRPAWSKVLPGLGNAKELDGHVRCTYVENGDDGLATLVVHCRVDASVQTEVGRVVRKIRAEGNVRLLDGQDHIKGQLRGSTESRLPGGILSSTQWVAVFEWIAR